MFRISRALGEDKHEKKGVHAFSFFFSHLPLVTAPSWAVRDEVAVDAHASNVDVERHVYPCASVRVEERTRARAGGRGGEGVGVSILDVGGNKIKKITKRNQRLRIISLSRFRWCERNISYLSCFCPLYTRVS